MVTRIKKPAMFRRVFRDGRSARRAARSINWFGANAIALGCVVVLEFDPPTMAAKAGMYLRNWELMTD